jgi:hypothetical protein
VEEGQPPLQRHEFVGVGAVREGHSEVFTEGVGGDDVASPGVPEDGGQLVGAGAVEDHCEDFGPHG